MILLRICIFLFLVLPSAEAQDWANLNRFKADNDTIAHPLPDQIRVVFMGNSITEGWKNMHSEFWEGKPYHNRGISGQTTPQMLLRFRQDVIDLYPEVVVILAGTNDIAGNTGPATIEEIAGNIISMADLAKVNGIKVVISSILPAYDYPWKPGLEPALKIVKINEILKTYSHKNDMIYLDYFTAMADENYGLLKKYTYDGVHPNIEGYKAMETLLEQALRKAIINRND